MDQWLEEIRAALPELVVYQQEPMKKHTTFRVGGPADLYVCPKKQELPVILGLAKKNFPGTDANSQIMSVLST